MKQRVQVSQPVVKFGSKGFFHNYISEQLEKEDGNRQEVVARIHFAMSSLILETHKGQEAFTMLQNLTQVAEKLTEWKKSYVG